MEEKTEILIQEALSHAISYPEYREMVEKLALEGKTTGPEQAEALINYTVLNDRRMRRWDKTLKLDDDIVNVVTAFDQKVTWLVLTESWCGDASPSLPVMHKITQLNTSISLRIIMRDEHAALMNRFLTKGAMSIPKLIMIKDATQEVIGEWGPRSFGATLLVEAYKAEHGQLTAEFKQDLQTWYNKDKGRSVAKDLASLLLK